MLRSRWGVAAGDGRALFYGWRDRLLRADVGSDGEIEAESRRVVLDLAANTPPYSLVSYDVSPDGKRFLIVREPVREQAPAQIVVAPNFAAELAAKLPRN